MTKTVALLIQVLRILVLLFDAANRRGWIKEGERLAIAAHLAAISKSVGIAKEVRDEVSKLPDAAVHDRLSKYYRD